MKGKLRIIILAAIAITSFGVSYFVSPWFGGPQELPVGADLQTPPSASVKAVDRTSIANEEVQPVTIAMKGRELAALITELRLKIDNCRAKEKDLDIREKRTAIAADVLKKQAQELEQLRLRLIPVLQRYQEIKKELETSQIRILAEEDKNIKLLAGRYDAMDAEGASNILTELWVGNQQDLAVKILYYMQARSAAKVLAAISTSGKKGAAELAAELSKKFPMVRKPSSKKG